MNVQITSPDEIAAVESDAIAGTIYADGACYAEVESLNAWRLAHGKAAPEASAAV